MDGKSVAKAGCSFPQTWTTGSHAPLRHPLGAQEPQDVVEITGYAPVQRRYAPFSWSWITDAQQQLAQHHYHQQQYRAQLGVPQMSCAQSLSASIPLSATCQLPALPIAVLYSHSGSFCTSGSEQRVCDTGGARDASQKEWFPVLLCYVQDLNGRSWAIISCTTPRMSVDVRLVA